MTEIKDWSEAKRAAFRVFLATQADFASSLLACPCLTCTTLRETFERGYHEEAVRP
jgi:hypothetical protein